jgi:hypothetical protein
MAAARRILRQGDARTFYRTSTISSASCLPERDTSGHGSARMKRESVLQTKPPTALVPSADRDFLACCQARFRQKDVRTTHCATPLRKRDHTLYDLNRASPRRNTFLAPSAGRDGGQP